MTYDAGWIGDGRNSLERFDPVDRRVEIPAALSAT